MKNAMKKFNHAYDLGFSLESTQEDARDVKPEMLRHALMRRIIELDEDDAWIEATGRPFDTYELEDASA